MIDGSKMLISDIIGSSEDDHVKRQVRGAWQATAISDSRIWYLPRAILVVIINLAYRCSRSSLLHLQHRRGESEYNLNERMAGLLAAVAAAADGSGASLMEI